MIIISSRVGAISAKILANNVGCLFEEPFKTANRNFENYSIVFKYGFSPVIKTKPTSKVWNKTDNTKMVIQKHVTFDKLKKHNITVPYTTDLEEAATWLEEGETVVSRAVDDGHNGKGLTYITNQKELHNTKAVFWTKFIDHTNEFRINIWRNKVVSVYDKIQKNELFHFKHFKGVEEQPQLLFLVNTIYNTIGLDFCGLDVLRDKEGNLHLLEINSAPTLHKETLENLTKIIKEEIKNG